MGYNIHILTLSTYYNSLHLHDKQEKDIKQSNKIFLKKGEKHIHNILYINTLYLHNG